MQISAESPLTGDPAASRGAHESYAWLRAFNSKRGRPLRVLHIGNIANNAYNNAKIQRERGIDADVLSFDYYHIMASPEWEDAQFSGVVRDDFFPDWWAVDLKGFRRPRWFVAGPLDACVRYLLAKTAKKRSAKGLWRMLTLERWLLSHRGAVRDLLHAAIRKFAGSTVAYQTAPANALLMTALGTKLEAASRHCFVRNAPVGRWLQWRGQRLRRFGRTAHLMGDGPRHLHMARRNAVDVCMRSEALFKQIDRKDIPDELEFFYQWWWHPYLSLLFRRYDVVQCYATYTALPFVSGSLAYVAYEHGTIRSIPFQPTPEGRMCMASYRGAAAVLITNQDNIAAAEKMRIDPRRITYLPHAFDSDKFVRFAKASRVPHPGADKKTTFVTPSRQHWVDNDPGWAKGNDRVFAALRILKDKGRDCVLRAIAWGNDVEASRARVVELGIEDMVQWLPKKNKAELWLEYLNAHAVIDQFVVPAFGGVTFEAMMLGRRVITYLDERRADQFFGSAPPLFSCRSAEEIAQAMIRIIADPADADGGGRANQEWMTRYHSADRIVSLQTTVYRRIVENSTAVHDRGGGNPSRRDLGTKCHPTV